MFDKIQNWALEGDMDGFDTLAAEEIGFDYMSLLKGAGGMMSGAGGMFGGDSKSGGGGDAAAAAEKARAAAEKAAAESSARTWKVVGGIALGVLGLIGVGYVMRPTAAPKGA